MSMIPFDSVNTPPGLYLQLIVSGICPIVSSKKSICVKSSRLMIAPSLSAYANSSAGVSLEEAEAAVREELNELQTALVQEHELEKVKNKFESTQIFGNINYLNVATNLAWFELNGQAEDMEKEVERYRAVTADRLKAVAQTAFREENGVVLYYKSSKGEQE